MQQSYLKVGSADSGVRLIAFHHAAGSAASLLPVAKAMPDDCEAYLFELEGRFGDGPDEHEPASVSDFQAAADRFRKDFIPLLDRPTLIVGHSLGALFAHNLLASLPAERLSHVLAFVASACKGPAAVAAASIMPPAPFTHRTRQMVMNDLRKFGGMPDEIFSDPELVEIAVTLLGRDLHLADTYALPDAPPVNAPYLVWYGADDATLSEADLTSWADASALPAEYRRFPGGHFFLFQQREPIAQLRKILRTTAVPSPTPQIKPGR
ncbi:alpha/beta fold hydrolase [Streptomyces sp. NPDC005474]|uniref:thioesterase II family protein n=1 Tax=Streptomyces sp. NPDC005474 TaxID=3154878 RepID=UPI00345441F7